jgi:hypothetical protein
LRLKIKPDEKISSGFIISNGANRLVPLEMDGQEIKKGSALVDESPMNGTVGVLNWV